MKENNAILRLLENDSTLTAEQLAVMCDKEVGDIRDMIKKYEQDGVIVGYKTLIDWDKTDREYVTALIELKVSPQRERGFDLAVFIEGRTMKEVAFFVAQKLAPLDSIVSTATHFVLKKYKDKGVNYTIIDNDERGYTI